MRRNQYVESESLAYPGLQMIEYHDGGFSQYGMSYRISERDGHALVMNGESGNYNASTNPEDKSFAFGVCAYDSAMDYAEMTTRSNDLTPAYNENHHKMVRRMEESKAWYGGLQKITDGYDMICAGWEEGARRASLGLSDTKVPEIDGIESMRRNLIFSDQGETLNIDQAMAGNWDKAWQTCRRIRSGVSRVLSVAIPFGGNCNRTADEMFWNGAQGMIITDILEDKGYRVQLYAIHYSLHRQDGYVREMDIVNLKRSDEPLRMDSIAAVIAHAGVFRTAGFCAVVAKPIQVNSGLGHCEEEGAKDGVIAMGKLGKMHPDTITLKGAYTKEKAVENIIQFFEDMKRGARNE